LPYAENNGIKIFYKQNGAGKNLVLVIGLTGTTDAWYFNMPELSRHFHILTLDNRGAGKSDKPDQEYSATVFAQDLKAVLDAAGINKTVLLSLSMGGLIAQEFYHLYPGYVEALILGCTGVGLGDPDYIKPEQEVLDILYEERKAETLYQLAGKWVDIFYHPQYGKDRQKIIKVQYDILNNPAHQPEYAYKRQLEACTVKVFNSPRLKNIKVPTLIIHGDADKIWPLENARYLAKHIPNSKLEIIPNSAHMFFIEKKEIFHRLVIDFINSLPK
jgi:pimeloyl-ACP methyl ester carboxylesterase